MGAARHRDDRMKIRQVVVTGKEAVELQDLELDGSALKPRELLIETEMTFISAGTELANYTATDAGVYQPGSWCAYPWKSGYANVGTVLDAGETYRDFIGRRVYTNGPHASVIRYETDVQFKLLAPVPEKLPSVEAVAARIAMVAICGLDAAKPQYIRTVVVIGLGMVGNLAAQLFRLTGARVIGVDPSETRRRLARECGVDHVIGGNEAEVAAQVKELTGGKMANVTVDAVGHSAICLQALRLTATSGELVVLGSPRVAFEGNLTEVFQAAHFRWITIRGALEWNVPTEGALPFDYSQRKKLDAIFGWMADGRLNVKPLLTHVLPPEEIKMAYEGLLREKEKFVGVVLKWR
jgi:2-desacetyl-2-hydroxyethyl bacteriochlorophyllide A dehydrogenase